MNKAKLEIVYLNNEDVITTSAEEAGPCSHLSSDHVSIDTNPTNQGEQVTYYLGTGNTNNSDKTKLMFDSTSGQDALNALSSRGVTTSGWYYLGGDGRYYKCSSLADHETTYRPT